jgi:hypothetical protein
MGADGTFFRDWDIDETTSRLSPGFIPQPKRRPLPLMSVFTGRSEVTRSISAQGALFRISVDNRHYHYLFHNGTNPHAPHFGLIF